ncbi:hypothetical protein LMG28138_02810 [Pararobbsia alpina]|uniref:Uncharacterized protein n=1 Tax=Pararobbsia alpina TaxID=621374 RepID=A0A6S7B6P8_9BURK|nr:hypothetical protein LMG28138_02810 [Pararobbsia alpina]
MKTKEIIFAAAPVVISYPADLAMGERPAAT